jgi:predicted RNA binding protein YcfA (HicA-like mRNA interferase family)
MPKLSGVSHRRAINTFEKAGFIIVRQGKHVSMVKENRIIIIPRANPINAYTMAGIIKDAGLSIEEFKKLL